MKYFTAIVRNDEPAETRQRAYLAALAAHSGPELQIIYGHYQDKPQRCRACGATWPSYEEKETDVNIAVSLVADVAQNLAETALLISADSDLLKAVVSGSLVLARADLRNSLLPEIVTDPATGNAYHRPPS